MRRLAGLLLLAGTLCTPSRLTAQVGVTTDIIIGSVRDEAGSPVADAIVDAMSLETQITRTARTNARGQFTIIFPDGGGQYRMSARAIGRTPAVAILERFGDEDRLIWNAQLNTAAVQLEEINVRAAAGAVRIPDRPTPGTAERAFVTEQAARLPLDVSDLNMLATLVPGVLGIAATDTSGSAFSVGGQRADANAITLDGLLFGTGLIPQEGVRNTRVVTSTYDVSRGQFSGGLIASTTRSGSNMVQGSGGYVLRDDDLAIQTEGESSPFTKGFSQHQLSAGLGGPIRRDRMFVFGSATAQLRANPQTDLLSATATDLTRLGVHPDSVDRFLSLVEAAGINPRSVEPVGTRDSDNLSAMLRLDYLLSNSHTLVVRGDWRGTVHDPTGTGSTALPQTGGTAETDGGGVMASLTSRFGVNLINEGRVYWTTNGRESRPFTQLPQGRVQVASTLPDGVQGVSTLSFGGGLSTQLSSGSSLEASNELSWIPGSGRHRVKLGGLFLAQESENTSASNLFGTWTWNSLADLEANRPSSFRRTLNPTERSSRSYDYALYAGDVWYSSSAIQITYGLRLEGSSFGQNPAYNPDIETLFGVRNDRLPTELHLSPRVGFTWTIGGSRAGQRGEGARFGAPTPPALIVRGGIGEFRSPIPGNLASTAQNSTGLAGTEAQITCVGSGVPAPDWRSFRADLDNIPAQCLSGPVPVAEPARTVALFAEDYAAPRSWRASLGLQRNLTTLLRLSADLSWARGVSQYGFYDLNLVDAPRFSLASEGGRPVYTTLASIAPTTGAVNFTGSRIDPRYGQVQEIRSDLGSESLQATISLGGLTRGGIALQGAYTWQQARDHLSSSGFGGFGRAGGGGFGGFGGGFGGSSTAGDPRVFDWSRSDFERKHSILTTVTWPFGVGLEVTGIGRLSSGAPFTPMVGSDINGDGVRNDRAWLFSPGNGSDVAQGMDRLLASSNGRIADCLRAQLGAVAGRNSCTGPWQGTFDLQVNWRPNLLGFDRRLSVSLTTVNLLRGIDELVHGSDNAKGWGLNLRPDPTLLYVTGFDPVAKAYRYTVNERFGATGSGANAFRSPFQIGLQFRFTIGPNRMQQALDGLRGGGGGGGRFGGGGPGGGFAGRGGNMNETIGARMAALPNPAHSALELRETLALSADQVTRLEQIRDSLAGINQTLAEAVTRELANAGASPDPMQLMSRLRPRLEEVRTNLVWALDQVRALLSPAQWALLPETVRNPAAGFRPGAGRPGAGDGARRPPAD